MRFSILITVVVTLSLSGKNADALTDKEIVSAVNKVVSRVAGGDVSALDDLKVLPRDSTIVAALMFFSQNFYSFHQTKQNGVIAAKSAEIATSAPDAEEFFKNLFKKQPTEKLPNWFLHQRDTAIDLLVFTHGKVAVRVLADSLSEPALDIPAALIGGALADMNIPNAPFSKHTKKEAKTSEGVAKWKEWWKANKTQYVN